MESTYLESTGCDIHPNFLYGGCCATTSYRLQWAWAKIHTQNLRWLIEWWIAAYFFFATLLAYSRRSSRFFLLQQCLRTVNSTCTVAGTHLHRGRDVFEPRRSPTGGSTLPGYPVSCITASLVMWSRRRISLFQKVYRVTLCYFDPRERREPHQLRRR